jgi:hypothetical protein
MIEYYGQMFLVGWITSFIFDIFLIKIILNPRWIELINKWILLTFCKIISLPVSSLICGIFYYLIEFCKISHGSIIEILPLLIIPFFIIEFIFLQIVFKSDWKKAIIISLLANIPLVIINKIFT